MSTFNFTYPQIDHVRFRSDGDLEISFMAERSHGGEQHLVVITTCPMAMTRLLRSYVEACNRELEAAESRHIFRKHVLAERLYDFKKTGG